MTDDRPRTGPPAFERPFEGEDTKQRVYGAVLHARDPMTAAEIAERASCSTESARAHLSFYADLGIVLRHEGRPVSRLVLDSIEERINTLWERC